MSVEPNRRGDWRIYSEVKEDGTRITYAPPFPKAHWSDVRKAELSGDGCWGNVFAGDRVVRVLLKFSGPKVRRLPKRK